VSAIKRVDCDLFSSVVCCLLDGRSLNLSRSLCGSRTATAAKNLVRITKLHKHLRDLKDLKTMISQSQNTGNQNPSD